VLFATYALAFSDNNPADKLCDSGINYYRQGQYNEALQEFQKALALEPDNPIAKNYINLIFKKDVLAVSSQTNDNIVQPSAISEEKSVNDPKNLKEQQLAENQDAHSICDSGINYYRQGKYNEALQEFEKVLKIDPDNSIAKSYIDMIFKEDVSVASSQSNYAVSPPPAVNEQIAAGLKKNQAYGGKGNVGGVILAGEKPKKRNVIEMHGETRLALGVTPEGVIWKDANADKIGIPREKNWRYLWGDKRQNTYDSEIYNRFKLDMNTRFDSPLNAFMEINIDPWTFIGKNRLTVTSVDGGDSVDIDLKYWSNSTRTINEIYRSRKGNIINLNEIKVVDGKTTPSTPNGIGDWHTNFNEIEPMQVNRTYRPVRKFWLDYKQDDYSLKIFPLSNQFEALTSEDPMRISNNHMYWEESPWLDEYEPSTIFERTNNPIKMGKWVRRMSFFAKDSSEDYPHRLTFLRGATFNADSGAYSLKSTVATPLSFWDEYYRSNSVEQATQFKLPLADDLKLGFLATTKIGLNGGSAEALNQVEAVDLSFIPAKFHTLYAEVAESHTDIQEAAGFDTVYDGVGAKLGWGYDETYTKDNGLYKGGVYLAYMDANFYPGLSNYRYTRRDDPTFSRHIYFAGINPDDRPSIWGDGMDRGRNALGFNFNARGLEQRLENELNYRNVHQDTGKYIESVLRNETTYKVNPRLTTKLLLYYQHLHKTHAREDPLIYAKTTYALTDYFAEDDRHVQNDEVIDNKDPSVGAFDLGAKYELIEKVLAVEGIYERTNDPLDFPRGLLNDTYVIEEVRDGRYWDKVVPFLYDQKFFDMPPYSYYNIAKMKFTYTPAKEWEYILSYTFNENKHAAGLDDNINHLGFEATYRPCDKWTFWLKYIYSATINLFKQNLYRSSDFFEWHHNVFVATDYNINKDESFSILYGEFVSYNDPYEQVNWTLSALDTQHIIRLFYRRKF
jgi:tetratricopeptide (TPR) repeat protein